MQLKWASRTRDTLVKAQILALMATVRAAGAGRAPDASNPAALEVSSNSDDVAYMQSSKESAAAFCWIS